MSSYSSDSSDSDPIGFKIYPYSVDDDLRKDLYLQEDIPADIRCLLFKEEITVTHSPSQTTNAIISTMWEKYAKFSLPAAISEGNEMPKELTKRYILPSMHERFSLQLHQERCRDMTATGILEVNEKADPNVYVHFQRAIDLAGQAEKSFPTAQPLAELTWTSLYNSFFLSLWHDTLRDRGVRLQIRPRWSYALSGSWQSQEKGESIGFVPDIVLSFPIEVHDIHLQNSHPKLVHPEYHQNVCNCDAFPTTFHVPFFLANYVKSNSDLTDADYDHQHLLVAMESILKIYALYSISTPLFGMLFDHTSTNFIVGYYDLKTKTTQIVRLDSSPFELATPVSVLHLRLLLSNIPERLTKEGPWKADAVIPPFRPEHDHPQCDLRLHDLDPWLTEDPARTFVYDSSKVTMEKWFHSRQIFLVPFTGKALQERVNLHLAVFTKCCLPSDLSGNLQNCSDTLTSSELVILQDFLSTYTSTAAAPRTKYRNVTFEKMTGDDWTIFLAHLSRGVSACSTAREINNEPTSMSLWASLYDSLILHTSWFDTAFEPGDHPKINIFYNQMWATHRSIGGNTPDEAPKTIVVDAVFSTPLAPLFSSKAFEEYKSDRIDAVESELCLDADSRNYFAQFHLVVVPLIVVEHVKSKLTDAHEYHLNHLAISMKSALALQKVLALPNRHIIGLLCDHNIVTVVIAWGADSEREDKIVEIPKTVLSYDILQPMDILRLRLALNNRVEITRLMTKDYRAFKEKAAIPFLNETFTRWRESNVYDVRRNT